VAAELLGGVPRSTLYKWKTAAGTLSQDQLTRISYIVGIYKALHILLPDDVADHWKTRPNDHFLFQVHPPVDIVLRVESSVFNRCEVSSIRSGAVIELACLKKIEQRETRRLILTQHLRSLETLPLPAEVLSNLSELDAATNERKKAEIGQNHSIGPGELLSGVPEAVVVNAAFSHGGPAGARFNHPARGA
jgi:hypothetical protein